MSSLAARSFCSLDLHLIDQTCEKGECCQSSTGEKALRTIISPNWIFHCIANTDSSMLLLPYYCQQKSIYQQLRQALTLWLFKWDKSPVGNITVATFHYGLLIDSTTWTPCRHIYTMVYTVTQQNIDTFLKG